MQISPRAVLETALYVDDLDLAFEFYATVLNLPMVHGDQRMRVLRVSDQNFLLLCKTGMVGEDIEVEGGTIPAHEGTMGMHMAFTVDHDDIAAWEQNLKNRGVAVESTVNWRLGDISLYFRDPAGNLIELATPDLWIDR